MKTLFIGIAAILVILACSLEVSGPVSEYFSKKDLNIITNTYNEQTQTRTVLYGNPSAEASFKDPKHQQRQGAIFKLYTYKESTDPVSFDFNVKSTLLKTEIVTIKNIFPDSVTASYNRVQNRRSQTDSAEIARIRISAITKLNAANLQK